jgi:hypothetical protein
MVRDRRSRKTAESAVDLAIAAIEGQPNVMDMPMVGFDPSPGALDLPAQERRQVCVRCGRPAVDRWLRKRRPSPARQKPTLLIKSPTNSPD